MDGKVSTPKVGVEPDAALLLRLREGSMEAYEELWRRHIGAALRVAHAIAPQDGGDLVSEAFLAVHHQVAVAGNGPESAFRAYLFTVIRNIAGRWAREGNRVVLDPDIDEIDISTEGLHLLERDADASQLLTAFKALPIRWQRALWLSEIEGEKRAAIAAEFGLTPNATSALLKRARAGLRQEWLLEQIPPSLREDPVHVVSELPALLTGQRSPLSRAQVEAHLRTCPACAETAAELRSIAGRISRGAFSLAGFAALGISLPAASAIPGATTAGVTVATVVAALATGATAIAAGIAVATTAALSPVGDTATREGTGYGPTPRHDSSETHSDSGVRPQESAAESNTGVRSDGDRPIGRGIEDPTVSAFSAEAAETNAAVSRPGLESHNPGTLYQPEEWIPESEDPEFHSPTPSIITVNGPENEDDPHAFAVTGIEQVNTALDLAEASSTGVVVLISGAPGSRALIAVDSGQSLTLQLDDAGEVSVRLRFLAMGFYTVSFGEIDDERPPAEWTWIDWSIYVSDPDSEWGPFGPDPEASLEFITNAEPDITEP